MGLAVVVQARTGSTRLPGKVLLPVAGAPLLQRMIERVLAAKTSFDLVVATTTDAADDPVAELAARIGVRVFRGHPTDLLDRHVMAARSVGADVVAKVPSDCPLLDPAILDRVLGALGEGVDFASNLHPATWPDGHDVEVMTMAALETAHREATKPHEREHTTPFLWDQPDRFRCVNVTWESGENLSMSHRMTIDYPEDYAFVAAVYDSLWSAARPIFPLDEILDLLERRPDVFALNAKYAGVNWYRNHLADLKTVRAEETRCVPS
ncbi:MAG TPA: glycosyltransferase family protein [Labilithrix sp.]|jgi:spore coat polysaccharide biosynthesis protein SpsF